MLSPLAQTQHHRSRWRTLATHDRLALLVDLDGTLIDFAPTPQLAVLHDAAVRVLEDLIAAGVHVAVVSGRPRASIEPMRARLPNAWWVAEHGAWRWDRETCVEPVRHAPELDHLASRLEHLLCTDGVLVERKSLSLCIHWRRVPEPARTDLVAALETACDEWLEEHLAFERLPGVELVEIRRRNVHKGVAVRWVRDHIRGVRVIAIGDDVTDEDMFAELDDNDAAVSVGPGGQTAAADAHAPDTAAVHAFLRWIVEVRCGRELPLPIVPAAAAPQRKRHRLLVMSNRTPALDQDRMREVGGLVSALEPALRDERGLWLGWSGHARGDGSRIAIEANEQPARARFDMPAEMREQFYAGFCNRVLWPLFHGFPSRVNVRDGDWEAYVRANDRYARHAIDLAQRDATIWVHDYHLLLAARAMRAAGHTGRIGHFLHVPFPAPDLLETLPWAAELVTAMLDYDLLGFQTEQVAANFLAAARAAGHAVDHDHTVRTPGRTTEVGVFPVAIDPRPFTARGDEVREVAGLRAALGPRRLVLGVDRLDYSKGIPERLEAYEQLLDRFPEWRKQVSFLQISVPSRAEIPDYAELRQRVEGLVGRINGRFGETDWVPVRYLYRSYDHHVLAQLYRLAKVALVTPLRDGMNLVAKEFVAAQDRDEPGVLVLSRHAGAADAFADALLTDPFHPERLAADLDRALRMSLAERARRHRNLLAALEAEGDARAWAQRFLDRLAPHRLHPVD